MLLSAPAPAHYNYRIYLVALVLAVELKVALQTPRHTLIPVDALVLVGLARRVAAAPLDVLDVLAVPLVAAITTIVTGIAPKVFVHTLAVGTRKLIRLARPLAVLLVALVGTVHLPVAFDQIRLDKTSLVKTNETPQLTRGIA